MPIDKFMPRTTYRPKKQDSDSNTKEELSQDVKKTLDAMEKRIQTLETSLEEQQKHTAKLQELVDDLRQWGSSV
jgi:predicted RNase H-like nuclease (RuvC/YqgF family)